MRTQRRRLGVLLLLAAIAAGCGPAAFTGRGGPTTGVSVGAIAPDFQLVGLDGKPHALSEYRGHVVLVNFWATWCIPCRAEMPELQVTYRKRQAQGVVFLGVDWKEGRDVVQSFISDRQVTYPVLLDADGHAYGAFQVGALPQTFVLDRTGKIAVVRTGLATRDQFDRELRTAGA